MTTTSRMFRMKTVKKLGLPLWPWRQMNSKQAQKLEKSTKFQNKQIFDNDVNLLKAISKVMKRTSDAKSTIQYLRKILNLHSDPDTIASYNFFNNYIFDWNQSDYYQNSKKINQKLPIFSSGELINLKFSKKEKINIGFVSSDIRSKHSITYFLKTVLRLWSENLLIDIPRAQIV